MKFMIDYSHDDPEKPFKIHLGFGKWSESLTPYELDEHCKRIASKPVHNAQPKVQPRATAIHPSGHVIIKKHPSLEALRAMGYKSLNHYLKRKGLLPEAEDKSPRAVASKAEERRKAAASLDLDLSFLKLDL